MADEIGQFEISDNQGSTVSLSGTATTTLANLPTVADKVIASVSFWNDGSEGVEISFDAGNTFFEMEKRSFLAGNVRGDVKQLQIRTLANTSEYRAIIEFEDEE